MKLRPYSVLNCTPDIDWRAQPMFLGEPMGLSRSDQVRYPIFQRLTEEQYSNYWRPHDINLDQDRRDFETLLPNVKHVFLNNLAYQSLLDSVQSRATVLAFLPWVSCPELEACIKVWAFFEEIHNKSYEYVLKNVFADPTPFLNTILNNTAIMKRAKSLTMYYDDLLAYSTQVLQHGYTNGLTKFEHKRKLYRAILSVYVLEGVRFYVSFACTFAIAQQDTMLGSAKQVKLIARDEALHVGITLNILRLWPKEDPEFAVIAMEERDTAYAIFHECVEQEKEWGAYLLSQGQLLGITVSMMDQSIEARANQRMYALGLDRRYSVTADPFKRWMSNWMVTEDEQTAPQEVEPDAYKVSALERSVNDSELLDDF